MARAKPHRRVRASEASISDRGIAAGANLGRYSAQRTAALRHAVDQHAAGLWAALTEISEFRSLTRAEIHLRTVTLRALPAAEMRVAS